MKKETGIFLFYILFSFSCGHSQNGQQSQNADQKIIVGSERIADYKHLLAHKKIGLLVNHTSLVGQRHLVDTLLSLGMDVKRIFAPEHGFRGTADAGAHVANTTDVETGIEVFSLYGTTRKPPVSKLNDLDMLIFDIQDVGARFYTYISTMTYAMEACAEAGVPFMVLDRPNPNGHYVDGPVMQNEFASFIGLHRVPIVHGMTVGEYAQMVNEEGWLANGKKCELSVILCEGYSHKMFYTLPVKPSPNLPNMKSIYLYPTLCLFEATTFSVGRGTDHQFQVIGHPLFPVRDFSFVPVDKPGAHNPKHENKTCYGTDFTQIDDDSLRRLEKINLQWLIDAYQAFDDDEIFFEKHFKKLAGNTELVEQIKAGISEDLIRITWQEELVRFKSIRKKYLLYQDFNTE